MLIQISLLFILLTLLYLLSRKITSLIYLFFLFVFRSRKFTIGILALILIPGTFIHEMSHLIMAAILRVPTGKLSVYPKIEDRGVLVGHIMIGKTDPFRQTLIGMAPMITGLLIIYLIGNLAKLNYLLNNLSLINILIIFAICYLLFTISITMFSSRSDLKSLIIVGPVLIIVFASLYLSGIRLFFDEALSSKISIVFNNLNFYLLIANLVNLAVLIVFRLMISIGKILAGN